jgi:hypothetical protein
MFRRNTLNPSSRIQKNIKWPKRYDFASLMLNEIDDDDDDAETFLRQICFTHEATL